MADDLIVTDETIENPLVLKRLLSDIIERLSNTVNELADDNLVNNVINIVTGTNVSAIETQSEGETLSLAPTKFNFVGPGVTLSEIIDDEIIIEVTSGPILVASSEYCPGYTFVHVNDNTWQIDLLNVTNLFSVGRRLKFIDNALTYYGTITSIDYNSTQPNDTTIVMTMEDNATLTNTITEVCLVTGTTAWSRISADPFNGTAINDIIFGVHGTINYWVIIGDGGKLAYSTDGGIIWINVVTNTTENLRQIDYNPIDQSFIVVGNGGVILRSINGIDWLLDTEEIAAITTTGSGDVIGIMHDSTVNEWCVLFNSVVGSYRTAKSIDDGILWTNVGASIVTNSIVGLEPENLASGDDQRIFSAQNEDIYALDNPSDSSWGLRLGTSESTTTALNAFFAVSNRLIAGFSNGVIRGVNIGIDNITFGASAVNNFAYSELHQIVIAVGSNGKLGYVSITNLSSTDAWTLISTGFDPLTSINCIYWNEIEGIFIACASNGQICRSTSGLN